MPPLTSIETARLTLHPPTVIDAPEVFARYAQDARVTRYMSWRPHGSVDETMDFLRSSAEAVEAGTLKMWLIRERTRGQLLGSIGAGIYGHRTDFGYCLAHDAWGRGFATEAARAASDAMLGEPEIWRIAALCDVENAASCRVLVKSGFACEGLLRRQFKSPNLGDIPRDVYCYAKVADR